MVQKLSEIKAESGRDLDSLVDENLLIPAETGAGTFGVFRFFQGIRNFFKGISALGTLSSTGRIPTTDSDGNVNYVTPQQILDAVGTINGDKNFANNVSVAGALNVMGVNLDDKINRALSNYLQKISVEIGDGAHNNVPISAIGDGTYVVMLSALYSSWNVFYIGVMCIYGNDIRLDTLIHNGFAVTADRSNIYTNLTLSSARLIPFGYWG